MHKFVALIPARGGSKGIPRKNIKEMCGRPIICWTVDAALKCRKIDHVYISTDDNDIKQTVLAEFSSSASRYTVIDRKEKDAVDNAPLEPIMLDLSEKYEFDNIVLIQPTSPLLLPIDLTRGINKYISSNFDSLLSVVEQKRFVWKRKNGRVEADNYNPAYRPRRQEWNGYLVENGAFYVTGRQALRYSRCRLSGKIGCYVMPEDTYFELDEPSDWAIVELLLQKRLEGSHAY